MPQGMINRDTPIRSVPIAPHRESPKPNTGHAGLDAVAEVALKVRAWLKAEQLPLTTDALVALTGMAIKEQRRIDDETREAAKPKPSSPAPGNARRAAHPAKKEPTP
jgi:hypothetical protein